MRIAEVKSGEEKDKTPLPITAAPPNLVTMPGFSSVAYYAIGKDGYYSAAIDGFLVTRPPVGAGVSEHGTRNGEGALPPPNKYNAGWEFAYREEPQHLLTNYRRWTGEHAHGQDDDAGVEQGDPIRGKGGGRLLEHYGSAASAGKLTTPADVGWALGSPSPSSSLYNAFDGHTPDGADENNPSDPMLAFAGGGPGMGSFFGKDPQPGQGQPANPGGSTTTTATSASSDERTKAATPQDDWHWYDYFSAEKNGINGALANIEASVWRLIWVGARSQEVIREEAINTPRNRLIDLVPTGTDIGIDLRSEHDRVRDKDVSMARQQRLSKTESGREQLAEEEAYTRCRHRNGFVVVAIVQVASGVAEGAAGVALLPESGGASAIMIVHGIDQTVAGVRTFADRNDPNGELHATFTAQGAAYVAGPDGLGLPEEAVVVVVILADAAPSAATGAFTAVRQSGRLKLSATRTAARGAEQGVAPTSGLEILDNAFQLTDEAKIATRTMTRAEWYAYNRAQRIARSPDSWSTVRRDVWTRLGETELASPTGRFSETNIARMLEGLAPRVRAEVTSNRTGITSIRDISLELHHRSLPQRLRTPTANELWNLEPVYPWSHEGMDPYRHPGYVLERILNGTNSF